MLRSVTAPSPPLCPSCGQPASTALAGAEHDWECRNEACPEFGQPVDPNEPPPPEPPTVALGGKATGKLGTTLRKGLRLTVTSSAPGRLVARALVDKKTARRYHIKNNAKGPVVVASAAKNVGDGRTRVTLKFTKKAKKHLKHAKRVKLTVRAAITDIDGNTGVDSSKVVLSRKTR
jgi:hypothetical protein